MPQSALPAPVLREASSGLELRVMRRSSVTIRRGRVRATSTCEPTNVSRSSAAPPRHAVNAEVFF